MEEQIKGIVLAIVALKEKKNWVEAGSAPLFFASDEGEQQRMALYLSRALQAMVHDLGNGVFFLIRQ